MGYHIGTSKNLVSAKFLHTLYTIKSVYIEFLEPIKNCVSAKSMLKEAVYNETLLYCEVCHCVQETPEITMIKADSSSMLCYFVMVLSECLQLFLPTLSLASTQFIFYSLLTILSFYLDNPLLISGLL